MAHGKGTFSFTSLALIPGHFSLPVPALGGLHLQLETSPLFSVPGVPCSGYKTIPILTPSLHRNFPPLPLFRGGFYCRLLPQLWRDLFFSFFPPKVYLTGKEEDRKRKMDKELLSSIHLVNMFSSWDWFKAKHRSWEKKNPGPTLVADLFA